MKSHIYTSSLFFLLSCTLIRFREMALGSFTIVHCMREMNELFQSFVLSQEPLLSFYEHACYPGSEACV